MKVRCSATYEVHGVERRCQLVPGHTGDHRAASSAGPISWNPDVPNAVAVQVAEMLKDALERTLYNFELLLARKPVRDATETISEARVALAEYAKRSTQQ